MSTLIHIDYIEKSSNSIDKYFLKYSRFRKIDPLFIQYEVIWLKKTMKQLQFLKILGLKISKHPVWPIWWFEVIWETFWIKYIFIIMFVVESLPFFYKILPKSVLRQHLRTRQKICVSPRIHFEDIANIILDTLGIMKVTMEFWYGGCTWTYAGSHTIPFMFA